MSLGDEGLSPRGTALGGPELRRGGLAIGLISYDGRVNWGVVSDPDVVPDTKIFMGMLEKSLERLAEASGVELEPLKLVPDAEAG